MRKYVFHTYFMEFITASYLQNKKKKKEKWTEI